MMLDLYLRMKQRQIERENIGGRGESAGIKIQALPSCGSFESLFFKVWAK